MKIAFRILLPLLVGWSIGTVLSQGPTWMFWVVISGGFAYAIHTFLWLRKTEADYEASRQRLEELLRGGPQMEKAIDLSTIRGLVVPMPQSEVDGLMAEAEAIASTNPNAETDEEAIHRLMQIASAFALRASDSSVVKFGLKLGLTVGRLQMLTPAELKRLREESND
ncbi:hypothetical protein H6G00_01670 [Leptolyngbya sp. FACHB-541]|uniref:hypothetical protein n=1 Tax=Leptolyngbya sp. FACHB-541 TaxID=2692810 RepID=UPI0016829586|nr:hypothetical protein [Leptolyngbya sp. FACHB-541]MBD1995339.1 hypothetical protein [Leptolyngbya sp. FACHB-541]